MKKFLEANDNENTTNQNLWDAAKAVLKGQFTILPQETRKTLNRQNNFTPKTAGKRRRTTTTKKNQQKERNHKDLSRNR